MIGWSWSRWAAWRRADDVWQRIRAGATLVQLYTALVYEGPLLPRRLHEGLRQRLRAAGLASVNERRGQREARMRCTGP